MLFLDLQNLRTFTLKLEDNNLKLKGCKLMIRMLVCIQEGRNDELVFLKISKDKLEKFYFSFQIHQLNSEILSKVDFLGNLIEKFHIVHFSINNAKKYALTVHYQIYSNVSMRSVIVFYDVKKTKDLLMSLEIQRITQFDLQDNLMYIDLDIILCNELAIEVRHDDKEGIWMNDDDNRTQLSKVKPSMVISYFVLKELNLMAMVFVDHERSE